MELDQLKTSAFIFILAVITIIIGSTIVETFQTNTKTTATTYVINESAATLNSSTAYTLLTASETDFSLDTGSVVVYNNTKRLATANVTATAAGVISVFDNATNPTCTLCKVTYAYSYTLKDAKYNASNAGLGAMTTMSNFAPTIAIIIAAVLVIGLLMGFNRKYD